MALRLDRSLRLLAGEGGVTVVVAVRFTDFDGRSVGSVSTAVGEVAGAVVAGVEVSSAVVDDAATAASTTTFLRATLGVVERGDDERGALLAPAAAAAATASAVLLVLPALLEPLAPCGYVPMNRLSSWATRCWLRCNSCSR